MLNKADYISFLDIFSVNQKTFDHLNLKVVSICWQIASFKIRTSQVQGFVNFELSPMVLYVSLAILFLAVPASEPTPACWADGRPSTLTRYW